MQGRLVSMFAGHLYWHFNLFSHLWGVRTLVPQLVGHVKHVPPDRACWWACYGLCNVSSGAHSTRRLDHSNSICRCSTWGGECSNRVSGVYALMRYVNRMAWTACRTPFAVNTRPFHTLRSVLDACTNAVQFCATLVPLHCMSF